MVSGRMLRDAVINGVYAIGSKKREVDELNVFPVPDGDTGTNMSMTMNGALRELQFIGDACTASQIADITASALLRSARGNSGVILSLLFRGFAKGLAGKAEADCEALRRALKYGVEDAYKAVMNPVEGTMLTVARAASEKAAASSDSADDSDEPDDIKALWRDVCVAAKESLDKTPELLPVLKKAGVTDAGGAGLLIIWEAMLAVFEGGKITKHAENNSALSGISALADEEGEITFGYCTEFVINKSADAKDAAALRAFLQTIGDSVVCVDDRDIIKVHLHTDNPGKAVEEGLRFGALVNIKIDNMREQRQNKVKEAEILKRKEFTPAAPEKKYGFVAVSSGAGLEAMFKNLGADRIVCGGQTMNPSTDDILKAIYMTPAETVFILPNNKNIILTAEQTVKLADRKVCVLQTRTIPQGMSAFLAFDSDLDFNTNRLNMAKAIEKVSTGLVTFAARDSVFDGHHIKKGEVLALENGKPIFSERDINKAAYRLCKRLIKSDSEFVTIIYGADVTDERAEELLALVKDKYGAHVEIMLLNGGQPIYYYIISAE
ncbi:MAG: DAK2 domain-containing protein [Oscillospiraceae bacterium]|nr:DAK2 domain-containing protein [Oscillospiraceae bacterium]